MNLNAFAVRSTIKHLGIRTKKLLVLCYTFSDDNGGY